MSFLQVVIVFFYSVFQRRKFLTRLWECSCIHYCAIHHDVSFKPNRENAVAYLPAVQSITYSIFSCDCIMKAYKCDVCDKVFTERKNLLRHEKNTHDEKNSYPCELHNKIYGRTEDFRRHKSTAHFKSSKLQCSKCKKTFTRSDNMKRHKYKLDQETGCSPDSNEAPLNDATTKKMFPSKTPRRLDASPTNDKSFDEPPAKKNYFKCSVKPDQYKDLQNKELTESDPEVKDFMQKYWESIRSFTKKRKVQNIYICYDRDFKDLVETAAERIMTHQKNCFEINYSLAYILKNIETKELRYYHSSFNNAQILETALLINNQKELLNFLNSMAEESFYDGLAGPDRKWKVV